MRSIPGGGLVGTGLRSAAGAASTAIPDAASRALSAAVSVETSAINAVLPKNCSLGTDKFCIGFDSHEVCGDLPFNAVAVSQEGASFFAAASGPAGKALTFLKSLEKTLVHVTPAYIKVTAIIGLILLLPLAGLFAYFVFKLSTSGAFAKKIASLRIIYKLAILLCIIPVLAPFLVPVGILSVAKAEVQHLGQPVIGMDMGGVSVQLIESLICSGSISLGLIIAFFLSPWMVDKCYREPNRILH